MMTETEQFLNPSKIAENLVSRLTSFGIPGVDVDALMGTQRKNIEALATASRSAMDGASAVGKRQGEILQESMNRTARSLELLVRTGAPIDVASRQVELMKEGFDKALVDMRELAELVVTAQHSAVSAVSDRLTHSLAELKAATEPRAAPSAAAPASH
jgi:phasin family protein